MYFQMIQNFLPEFYLVIKNIKLGVHVYILKMHAIKLAGKTFSCTICTSYKHTITFTFQAPNRYFHSTNKIMGLFQ